MVWNKRNKKKNVNSFFQIDSEIWVTNGKAIHKYDTVSENWIVMGTVIDDINDLHKSEAGHIYVGGFFSKIG